MYPCIPITVDMLVVVKSMIIHRQHHFVARQAPALVMAASLLKSLAAGAAAEQVAFDGGHEIMGKYVEHGDFR